MCIASILPRLLIDWYSYSVVMCYVAVTIIVQA